MLTNVGTSGDKMMNKTKQTFYYSRHKLGMYLLFNLGLLALAVLFTWSIFPDYKPVYYFALGTCSLSILSALFVFLIRLPLAVIDADGIKIDHNQPLKWTQIKSVEPLTLKCFGLERPILRITPQKIDNYHMTLMQKIAGNSQFGSFSIPLYAMNDDKAQKIAKLIFDCLKRPKQTKTAVKKTTTTKKAPAAKTKVQTKKPADGKPRKTAAAKKSKK